jgi:hypothetical protein
MAIKCVPETEIQHSVSVLKALSESIVYHEVEDHEAEVLHGREIGTNKGSAQSQSLTRLKKINSVVSLLLTQACDCQLGPFSNVTHRSHNKARGRST